MKVWTTLQPSTIREIAAEVGVAIHSDWNGNGIVKDGRAWRFRLALKTDDPAIKKEQGHWNYQRTSAETWHTNADGSPRKVAAVCWHGHRDFMRAIFKRDPDARFKTAMADYRGSEDFESKYLDTGYRNVGSMMYPAYAMEVCTC